MNIISDSSIRRLADAREFESALLNGMYKGTIEIDTPKHRMGLETVESMHARVPHPTSWDAIDEMSDAADALIVQRKIERARSMAYKKQRALEARDEKAFA